MNSVLLEVKKSIQKQRMPHAILLQSALDHNIDYFVKESQTKKIRIASKSVRSSYVLKYIEDRLGDKCSGFMSYSTAEALWLLENGFNRILLGYPCVDKTKLEKLIKFSNDHDSDLTLMIDRKEHLDIISQIASKLGVNINVCVDVDMSYKLPFLNFGVFRSSIKTLKDFEHILEMIEATPYVKLNGVMGYEAQIAGVPDFLKHKRIESIAVRFLKKFSIKKIQKLRGKISDLLKVRNLKIDFFNAGGTGSVHDSRVEPWVTEITIGSGFYSPTLFDGYQRLQSVPSLLFGLRVTRRPEEDIYTCEGGGFVASGAIGIEKVPRPVEENFSLISTELTGEVQTPIKVKGKNLNIGDVVLFRHAKAGELCEHFNEIGFYDQSGTKIETIKTYRGEGQSFL